MNLVDVKVGDWMVLDHGDVAYFYQIDESGKPVLKANWMIGSLGLIDYQTKYEEVKNIKEKDKHTNWLINHYQDLLSKKIEDLEPVSPKMEEVLNQLGDSKPHMPLEGDLENPVEWIDDEEED